MSVEEYVKQIAKRLKCTGKKREEIRHQLRSDIEAEMEGGEAFEAVVKRMGTPREIADEFNQNMSESERRGYVRAKGMKICVTLAALVLCLLAFVYWNLPKSKEIAGSDAFRTESVEEAAKQAVMLLDENDYEALKEIADDEMQTFLNAENLGNAREQIAKDRGAFRQFGNVYMTEIEQRGRTYAVVELTVAYEKTNITYTISFDEDMKLAGLYMR